MKYRPITIIPVLYKLFARLVHSRLCPVLDEHQSADQAGFRIGVGTAHHLFAVTALQEKCYERQQNLWISTIDFKKAFDCVDHECMWRALARQGVSDGCIRLLRLLCSDQSARVRTDKL
eukprot:5618338-Pyramimonas_sp.AAC.1